MSWTREQIDNILKSNDQAVERAIIRLFEEQTETEQKTADAHNKNDRGFCASDARAGTRFARMLLGMNDRNQVCYDKKSLRHPTAIRIFSRYCNEGEQPIDRARRIALKHSKQLVEISNRKQ